MTFSPPFALVNHYIKIFLFHSEQINNQQLKILLKTIILTETLSKNGKLILHI